MPAWHVVVLVEHLVLNPQSRVFALRGGTPELQGWDAATVIAARTHNLIAGLVAGLAGGDVKMADLTIDYPGSTSAEAEPERQMTLAEFSVGAFTEFMYGKG